LKFFLNYIMPFLSKSSWTSFHFFRFEKFYTYIDLSFSKKIYELRKHFFIHIPCKK